MCIKQIKALEDENTNNNDIVMDLNNELDSNFIELTNDMDDFEINGLIPYELSEFDPNELQIYLPNEHNMTESEVTMIRNIFMVAHQWFTRGHNSTYNTEPIQTVNEPL